MQRIIAMLCVFHKPISIILLTVISLVLSTSNGIPVLALCFVALLDWLEFDHIVQVNNEYYAIKSFSIKVKVFKTFKEAYEYIQN